jgi:hypothetical protein
LARPFPNATLNCNPHRRHTLADTTLSLFVDCC